MCVIWYTLFAVTGLLPQFAAGATGRKWHSGRIELKTVRGAIIPAFERRVLEFAIPYNKEVRAGGFDFKNLIIPENPGPRSCERHANVDRIEALRWDYIGVGYVGSLATFRGFDSVLSNCYLCRAYLYHLGKRRASIDNSYVESELMGYVQLLIKRLPPSQLWVSSGFCNSSWLGEYIWACLIPNNAKIFVRSASLPKSEGSSQKQQSGSNNRPNKLLFLVGSALCICGFVFLSKVLSKIYFDSGVNVDVAVGGFFAAGALIFMGTVVLLHVFGLFP
jgi:hypothetical protein